MPGLGGRITIVTLACAPLASESSEQTIGAVPLQTPWLAVAEMKDTLDGNVSTTLAAMAVPGPALVIVRVRPGQMILALPLF